LAPLLEKDKTQAVEAAVQVAARVKRLKNLGRCPNPRGEAFPSTRAMLREARRVVRASFQLVAICDQLILYPGHD